MKYNILTLLTIICLLLPATALAFDITGRVASATDDSPLTGATLKLMTLPDSTFIVGGYSDKEGKFTLTSTRLSADTKVTVVVTFIGYQTTSKNLTIRPKTKAYDLKDVYMQEDTRILGEAVVSATPPPVVIREDTIEYYADSYKTQPDATAEDLLKRLPGVEVEADGSIKAQGETVEQIYVDGKEFFGKNTQVTTKNLTADMVESVQVVDMKTEEARLTGIDDGERRKVINLKLKPKMRRGWFGNGAAGWGQGNKINDRYEVKGMIGYFRGNSQNALVMNTNNTNNTGFGDLGDGLMNGSAMRGNRMSGRRGDGLNTSWSVGANFNYDEGNRMRDQNTPLAMGGDVMYGGSDQTERSKSHTVNYLKKGNTQNDTQNQGDNTSQNMQLNMRFEKSWGDIKEDGQHRIQIRPEFGYNSTTTDDFTESRTSYEDSAFVYNGTLTDRYLSQTERSSHQKQKGMEYRLSATYSFAKRLERGRRRTSITLGFNGRLNKGDNYTRSFTSYDSVHVDDLHLHNDTLINQWQEENSHNESFRVRFTHVEPIAEKQFIEFSTNARFQNRSNKNLYHFWNEAEGAYVDSVNGRSNLDYSSYIKTRNNNYTFSLSYRVAKETYNLNVGIDLLPQTQKYTDDYDHDRDYKRHYMNYSPRFEYRYNWNKKQNLRITLRGQTAQPSTNQLLARKNQTSATHVRLGNKDLDPSFSTDFQARYRSFDTETYRTIEASLSARGTFNGLSTKRWYSDNLRTDTTMTVNLSGLGDWNVKGTFRGSFPFYDNMWYITTETSLGYSETVGYANIKSSDSQINHATTTSGSQQAGIAFRGEKLNIEVRGSYTQEHHDATVITSGNLGTTRRYGVRGNMTAYLPSNFTLSSDIHYTARRGFSSALTRNQTIWNAQLSRTFLESKNLTAYIKVFDILREKSSISRDVNATSMVDRETTTLGQFFLVGASVKFNKMGGAKGRGRGNRQQRQSQDDQDFGGGFNGGGRRFDEDRM